MSSKSNTLIPFLFSLYLILFLALAIALSALLSLAIIIAASGLKVLSIVSVTFVENLAAFFTSA